MCFICGRSSCIESFHSLEEQKRFAPAIELYEKALELRQEIRDQTSEEEDEASEQEGVEPCQP